jgi:outer membrane protein assembly factor BamA
VRYGVDALRYINLYRGDRVLLLRAYAEAVTGPLDEIPFTDLPRLGGPLMLRGYHRDRFRDRIALLGTGEYAFPIGELMSGFLFLDAGRVERAWDDLSGDRIRYGFGGGIQLQSVDAFIMRFQVAGSADEPGVFIKLSFDPLYNPRPRATEKLSW